MTSSLIEFLMKRLGIVLTLVGLVCGTSTPSSALPSIFVVKTSATTGRLDIFTTGPGILGAELSIVLTGMKFTGVTINSAIFGFEKPGDNPFLPGLPEGGDTTGLWLRDDQQALFASYESQQVQPGSYQLLQFEYETLSSSMCVSASASGYVSVNGESTRVSSPQLLGESGCEGNGDTNGDGVTNLQDLFNVQNNFGGTSPPSLGDADFDGDIDLADLFIVMNNFGPIRGTIGGESISLATPEPSSLLLAIGAVGVVLTARQRL